ncbi:MULTISPECIES: glycosyltransferase family 4 protein [Streptosporangium]|uniref:Glycosyltransferase involved in cell wall biosynthesis n=1 Tax=Streptosporangium brasiliense TaxID=47480 RepID=A0ABT9REM3_9ACTN|nr:glycosyltransferase family 4 protein [Streptosporangium brasiliense]MDP9866840.1 glycosyltransferase involved in cell wall biosynthesis [Streptosporangium brasiliense]
MKPVSVTLVGSSPWAHDLHADDVNLRPALALAERLGAPYNVIVPAGGAAAGFVDLDPVRLYRVPDGSRPVLLREARHVIDHGLRARGDVLMSSDPLAAVAAELSRTRRTTPHIVQIQGDVLDPGPEYGGPLKRAALAVVSRAAVRRASAVRVVRRGLRERAQRLTRRPVIHVASRVDTRMFVPAPAPCLKPIHTVMVGSLLHLKNHATVLRAWPRVLENVPDARLVVLGEGPARSQLLGQARALGVEDHVELRGAVPQAEVVSVLQHARVLAHPSWSEGQPRAVLEAMACGLPVLCSDIPAHREIVGPEAGRLLAPAQARDWAEAITTLLTDTERARQMGNGARRYVSEHHDFELMIDRFADFIQGVVAEDSLRRR